MVDDSLLHYIKLAEFIHINNDGRAYYGSRPRF